MNEGRGRDKSVRNSPCLKCGLVIVTTFQREQYGKGEKS